MKRLTCLCLFLFWIASPAFPLEGTEVLCEVMEVSKPFNSSLDQLNGIRYILIHHANDSDRETLSKWLRANSGKEVRFVVNHREYRGILCRLAHCFGRGLLVYTGNVTLKKKDIIEVILSPSP